MYGLDGDILSNWLIFFEIFCFHTEQLLKQVIGHHKLQ